MVQKIASRHDRQPILADSESREHGSYLFQLYTIKGIVNPFIPQ